MRWEWDTTILRSVRCINKSLGGRGSCCTDTTLMLYSTNDANKRKKEEIQLLAIKVNRIYKNDHLTIEVWRVYIKKKVCCMGCKIAILYWKNVHLRQIDLSRWAPVSQWQHIHRNSILLLCPSFLLEKESIHLSILKYGRMFFSNNNVFCYDEQNHGTLSCADK